MRLGCRFATSLLCGVVLASAAQASPQSQCTRAQVRAAVVSFVGAFNRGDLGQLDELFAAAPAFRWYSSEGPGRRVGARAKRRDTLIGYFRNRRAEGERIGLLRFRLNAGAPDWSNFEMTVRRSAEDFRAGRWFEMTAKGSAVCDASGVARFIVITFGRPAQGGLQAGATGRARS